MNIFIQINSHCFGNTTMSSYTWEVILLIADKNVAQDKLDWNKHEQKKILFFVYIKYNQKVVFQVNKKTVQSLDSCCK